MSDIARKLKKNIENIEDIIEGKKSSIESIDKNRRGLQRYNRVWKLILPYFSMDDVYDDYKVSIIESGSIPVIGYIVSLILGVAIWEFTFPTSAYNVGDFKLDIFDAAINFIALGLTIYACVNIVSAIIKMYRVLRLVKSKENELSSAIEKLQKDLTEAEEYRKSLKSLQSLLGEYNNYDIDDSDGIEGLLETVDAVLSNKSTTENTSEYGYDMRNNIDIINNVISSISETLMDSNRLEQIRSDKKSKKAIKFLDNTLKDIKDTGIYKDMMVTLINKAKRVATIYNGTSHDDEVVDNIIYVAIPKVYKLCCMDSETKNEKVIEAIGIVERKLDTYLNRIGSKLAIETSGTLSALREMLK